jgi:uncharacterized protein involved in outer membrane biogenesis
MSESPEGYDAGSLADSRRRKRRVFQAVAAFVVLIVLTGLLLPLVHLNRYHRTIADSLSRSLGHTVHLGSVNLQLFPLPGLAIQDLVVEEDPSFGTEPLLRAPTLTVYLRLSSLWTQRLEISRISLDQASVNLVRDPAGRWNFSSLVLQAQRTPTAPTAQRRAGSTLRFPYIEFTGARINFKRGNEKRPLSFLNADASIWLENPGEWRIRLEAQPARTDLDLDLADTGIIRLEGSLTRAATLDQLPLNLHAEWTGAQLGQVSRLMLGDDSGWRGDLRAEADITGTMQALDLHSRLRVANAHRIEFTPLNEFDIDARCQATYHHQQQSLDNLTCLWPTGDGHLLLTGSIPSLANPQPSLNLEINHTPVAFVTELLGLMRPTVPTTLNVSGTINGQFAWAPDTTAGKNLLTGQAVADTVTVHIPQADQPITFSALRFATLRHAQPQAAHLRKTLHKSPTPTHPSPGAIDLEPATFAAGTPTPMKLSGQFTRSGFTLHLTGEGTIQNLQPLAAGIGQLGTMAAFAPTGTAETDLTFTGPWLQPIAVDTGAPIASITTQGSAHLQHAELKPRWLPEPMEISTATAQFSGDTLTWANAAVSVNGIEAKGSVTYRLSCENPQGCPAQASLDFATLDLAALQSAILGTGRHGELLQAILSQVESPAPPWPALNATIHAQTLALGNLTFANAIANATVSDHRLTIVSLDAAALGGSAHAAGSAEAASGGPNYALNLTLTGVRLAEVAGLFNEKWGTGTLNAQTSLKLHGYSNLPASTTGEFHWTLNGDWSGMPLLYPAAPPKKKSKPAPWFAAGTIANQTLSLSQGPAVGTITFDRHIDLNWSAPEPAQPSAQTPPPAVRLSGTLAHPAIAETAPARKIRAIRGN